MTLGYDRPLYVLAFDHRGSFSRGFFGIEGSPGPEQIERIRDSKQVIFEGLRSAVASGVARESTGMLVDEGFGGELARRGKAEGFVVAIPCEKSGQSEFEFEYGEAFGEHIEAFDPAFAKVLIRYNPEGDGDLNARQAERLARLSAWLRERGRKLMSELLVPAEPQQLEVVDGDAARYDVEMRPGLMAAAIGELHAAGVEPDVWKIEGLDRREDCEAIAAVARAGGRGGVACVVLGRGANAAAVEHWLRQGAGVPGYIGFAIGRTIWWDPLKAYVDGTLPREEAAEQIGANHAHFIDVYEKG